MEVKPITVITNSGPKMVKNITKRMTKFCIIYPISTDLC
jgi:hypothetical protein